MSREDMKPSEIELKAYAKINLSLYVLSRRPDGYHDIKSLMQSINIFDVLKIRTKLINSCDYNCFFAETNIYLSSTNKNIPLTADNLAVKGAISVMRQFLVDIILRNLWKKEALSASQSRLTRTSP